MDTAVAKAAVAEAKASRAKEGACTRTDMSGSLGIAEDGRASKVQVNLGWCMTTHQPVQIRVMCAATSIGLAA